MGARLLVRAIVSAPRLRAIFPPRRPADPPEEPRMRIALLYPPPWKIPGPGEPAYPADGPPSEYREGDLDPDFYQTPYGLFTLGAEALRAGHQVKVINLSAYPWPEVTRVVRELEADLYGMSCWTANRRGVALTAREIKKHHPNAHVIVGGPHATPLAREVLQHFRSEER